jgi:hypothetical protein
LAVGAQDPPSLEVTEVGEVALVADDEVTAAGLAGIGVRSDPHRSAQPHQLGESSVRPAIGVDETVGTEGTVVVGLTEATADHQHAVAAQRVIRPLPDEASLYPGTGLEELPVLVQTAVAGPHGVAVLRHDQGSRIVALRPGSEQLDRRVHRACHVGDGCGDAAGVEATTARVEHEAPGVDPVDPGSCCVMDGSVSGLVAQRPADHARVMTIPNDHAANPVEDVLVEASVVAEARLTSMALHVRLVQHPQSQLVAQVVEDRVVRVVRRAHRVDVGRFHHPQVAPDVLGGHRRPTVRVVIVPVDALDAHRLTGEQQLAVNDPHRAKADGQAGDLDHATVRIEQPDKRPVSARGLRRPLVDVRQRRRQRCHLPRPGLRRCCCGRVVRTVEHGDLSAQHRVWRSRDRCPGQGLHQPLDRPPGVQSPGRPDAYPEVDSP